jgi:hypothetical protein
MTMSRWAHGAEVIQGMIEARHLQRVVADGETAEALLGAAARHVESARLTAGSDLEGAYSLAYDAARKSATALLAYQSLRPTSACRSLPSPEGRAAQIEDEGYRLILALLGKSTACRTHL